MPDRKIPQVTHKADGFFIIYNGVGIDAIRPEAEYPDRYDVQLYKILYGFGDFIEGQKKLGNMHRDQRLGSNFGCADLAAKVRRATQQMPMHRRFGVWDEEKVYGLLMKYASPDRERNDSNPGADFRKVRAALDRDSGGE